jgi:hypothetical protein
VSFDNESANHNKLVNSTNLQNSKAYSTVDNRNVVLALEAMKTADNTTSVAQRAMKTEMAEPNTNMMKTEMVEPNTDLPKTEMVEPDTNLIKTGMVEPNTDLTKTEMVEPGTNLNALGSETSNISGGNSTTGEENVPWESGSQREIQISEELTKRVSILSDLNFELRPEDM